MESSNHSLSIFPSSRLVVPLGMKIRVLSEIAVSVALAAVLDLISKSLPLPRLPYGGSVSLRMLPIVVVAWRNGWKAGVVAGGVYGSVDFLIHPIYVHPIQLLLDYPLAFGAVGIAGGWAVAGNNGWAFHLRLLVGILLGNGLRLICHFLSGVVFFAQFAPVDQPIWLYSLMYNLTYIVPEVIILIILAQLILRRTQSREN